MALNQFLFVNAGFGRAVDVVVAAAAGVVVVAISVIVVVAVTVIVIVSFIVANGTHPPCINSFCMGYRPFHIYFNANV